MNEGLVKKERKDRKKKPRMDANMYERPAPGGEPLYQGVSSIGWQQAAPESGPALTIAPDVRLPL